MKTNRLTSQGSENGKSETTPHLGSGVLYHLPKAVSSLPGPGRTPRPGRTFFKDTNHRIIGG